MLLTKVAIKNYRLLVDTELNIDKDLTLIVGRNNTGKTSCMDLIGKVLNDEDLSYDDYPLLKRKFTFFLLSCFMQEKISYDKLCQKIPKATIDFWVDYSLDAPDANLGALSPFIIDVDVDTTQAQIRGEYGLKMDEEHLRQLLEPCFFEDGVFVNNISEVREVCAANFHKLFGLSVYAINPKNPKDRQLKNTKRVSRVVSILSHPCRTIFGRICRTE